MAERTLTLNEYHYLTGYLDFAYGNDDLPDGAWMQMMVDAIDMLKEDADIDDPQFGKWDSHDIVMDFLIHSAREREAKEDVGKQT